MMNICFVVNQFNVVGGRQKTAKKIMRFAGNYYNVFQITNDNLFNNTDKNFFEILKFLKENDIKLIILISSFSVLNIWYRISSAIKIPIIYSEHCSPEYTLKRWNNIDRNNIIKCSKFVRIHFDSYKKYFPMEYRNKCIVIPNSIQFHNNSSKLKNVVLYVGRIVNDPKNISWLIDTFNSVNTNWIFKLYGKCNFSNTDNIKYMGSENNLNKIYSDASILLNASDSEGFGNSILEALSYSIPVLAVDDKYFGISKLIKNNINGIKCDKEDFAKNLLILMNNKNKIKTLSSQCKNTILEYDDNKILPMWLDMFNRALYE